MLRRFLAGTALTLACLLGAKASAAAKPGDHYKLEIASEQSRRDRSIAHLPCDRHAEAGLGSVRGLQEGGRQAGAPV